VSAALIGLITVPTIAWFFSQEDVGRMSILQVAISFSVLFFSLGLDQAYVREFHEAENKPALLKQALLPGFIILLVALILVVTLGGVGSLGDWLFGIESWRLSLLIALSFVFAFVSRFLSLVLRMNERGLAFSMSQVLPKLVLLSILGFFVVAGVERLLENLVLANTAAILSVVLVFSFNTRSESRAAL
jgi:O-antigen/teichoic acid export membrane protein